MSFKNYYQTLGIKPSASPDEIRRSYRKLAFKYHPDKNNGDILAEANFKEINEAYDTLSDTTKRNDYNLKHFYPTPGYRQQTTAYQPVTANSILTQSNQLKKLVATLDPYRLNQDALLFQLQNILSDYHVQLLLQENNVDANAQIIPSLLSGMQPLKQEYTQKLLPLLIKLAGADNFILQEIHQFTKRKQKEDFWKRYQVLIAVVVTFLLCLVIYLLGKR